MNWLAWATDPQIWISLATLSVLEIVLGIDNIIFVSIIAGKLPAESRGRARTLGLSLALVTRVLLLCSIYWLTRLTGEWFRLFGHAVSIKDAVMIGGGLFLLWKCVHEIHGTLEGAEQAGSARATSGMTAVIAQIIVIDLLFSLDSVITAVGLGQNIAVMIAAVVLAMAVMLASSAAIGDFVHRHPTIKMLALSFLLLVGVMLIADGCGQHVDKGYIYFAMAFAFGVEMLNIRLRGKRRPALSEDRK